MTQNPTVNRPARDPSRAQVMCKAILRTLERALGDLWTPETARAWTELWDTATATMTTVRTAQNPSLLVLPLVADACRFIAAY